MTEPLRPESLQRIGRYPVRRYIAGGGMSWIFEVVDPDLFDARRALKLLKPGRDRPRDAAPLPARGGAALAHPAPEPDPHLRVRRGSGHRLQLLHDGLHRGAQRSRRSTATGSAPRPRAASRATRARSRRSSATSSRCCPRSRACMRRTSCTATSSRRTSSSTRRIARCSAISALPSRRARRARRRPARCPARPSTWRRSSRSRSRSPRARTCSRSGSRSIAC